MKPITLSELATKIDAEVRGDGSVTISGVAPLNRAGIQHVSFYSNKLYHPQLVKTKAGAVLLEEKHASDCPVNCLISSNPRLSLAKLAALFATPAEKTASVHESAVVGKECSIHPSCNIAAHVTIGERVIIEEGVVIGPGVVIGNDCQIGTHTILHANVTLNEKVTIGTDCVINSGTVIGCSGFGYANDQGQWIKMVDLAGVAIGNKVEIGANTCIDRGFLENTTIGDNVIIDNLVQIGHNVRIGNGTAIAGCVGIAGSTEVGCYCLIGGGAKIAGHINICDNVIITASSAVNHSLIKPGSYSSGLPAKETVKWRKNVARFQYLDKMAQRIRALEEKIDS